jgi:hypothetical protein
MAGGGQLALRQPRGPGRRILGPAVVVPAGCADPMAVIVLGRCGDVVGSDRSTAVGAPSGMPFRITGTHTASLRGTPVPLPRSLSPVRPAVFRQGSAHRQPPGGFGGAPPTRVQVRSIRCSRPVEAADGGSIAQRHEVPLTGCRRPTQSARFGAGELLRQTQPLSQVCDKEVRKTWR